MQTTDAVIEVFEAVPEPHAPSQKLARPPHTGYARISATISLLTFDVELAVQVLVLVDVVRALHE